MASLANAFNLLHGPDAGNSSAGRANGSTAASKKKRAKKAKAQGESEQPPVELESQSSIPHDLQKVCAMQ